ncbi:MAG: hypothetical protein KA248_10455 [Kiritimatiellae bacterium]|nr:hypothetical protein [Kiritimatiellia bacterium]
MKSIEEFKAFYQSTILPDLEKIDEERKAVRNRVMIFWLVTAGLIVLVLAVGGLLE